jgi:Cro/C1-type HTH DNA-binding domain
MPVQRPRYHRGVLLDIARLDYQLALRGLRAVDLARLSGVPEATLSHARYGRPVREGTLARIARVLNENPILAGRDSIIAAPPARAGELGTVQTLVTRR